MAVGIDSNDITQVAILMAKNDEWTRKLFGKKFGEPCDCEEIKTFDMSDLPKNSRVFEYGTGIPPNDKYDAGRISPGSKSKVKSSVQRALRTQLVQAYPLLAPHVDEIIPKKGQLEAMKMCALSPHPERVTLYLLPCPSMSSIGIPLFFQHMSDTLLPHLKLVHRFPTCFPSIRIDRGAIRFVLSGATLMAPGLTSAGGRLPIGNDEEGKYGEVGAKDDGEGWYGGRELSKGEPVVICAEGKKEACAVGLLTIGTKEIKEKGKGPVVEEGHYLGDGLWKLGSE